MALLTADRPAARTAPAVLHGLLVFVLFLLAVASFAAGYVGG